MFYLNNNQACSTCNTSGNPCDSGNTTPCYNHGSMRIDQLPNITEILQPADYLAVSHNKETFKMGIDQVITDLRDKFVDTGFMTQAVYDTNQNGIVDLSEATQRLQNSITLRLTGAVSGSVTTNFGSNATISTYLTDNYIINGRNLSSVEILAEGPINMNSSEFHLDQGIVDISQAGSFKVTSPVIQFRNITLLDNGSGNQFLSNDGTYKQVSLRFQQNTPTSNFQVGDAAPGTVLANRTFEEVLIDAFVGYPQPSFTSFSLSGQSGIFEAGQPIPQGSVFNWQINNEQNLKPNSINLINVTDRVQLLTGSNARTYTTTSRINGIGGFGTFQFRVEAQNTKDQTFSRLLNVQYGALMYYGTSTTKTLNEQDIKSLQTGVLRLPSNYKGSYAMPVGPYKVFAIPLGFGTPVRFRDQATGFEVSFDDYYTVNVTNQYGTVNPYGVFVTTYELGSSLTITIE